MSQGRSPSVSSCGANKWRCRGCTGSFGFEHEHYDVSMRVGERALLPAVRSAPADALVLADGFSCRIQIAEATPRRALHLADVLEMAARDGVDGPAGDYPERRYVPEYGTVPSAHMLGGLAGMSAGLAAAVYLLRRRR